MVFNLIYFLQVFYIQLYMKYISIRRDSLYRNIPHFHRFDNPNDETKESENSIGINNFRKENTINIIIEKREIFPIKSDIKKCISLKKSNTNDNIEQDLISISLDRKFDSSSNQ